MYTDDIWIDIAEVEDIPRLCELLESLFCQEAEFSPDRETQERGLRNIIEGEHIGDVLVARKEGRVIGMVNILFTVSTALGARVGVIEDMVVCESARSEGVGSALINHALEHSRIKGCKRVTLMTDADNHGAHKFYQRHGFARSQMVVFRKHL